MLSFLSDDVFIDHVARVIKRASQIQENAAKKLHKNSIDPFAAAFEAGGFQRTAKEWEGEEIRRQAQKSLANTIGEFHQNILGSVAGVENLGVGQIFDIKDSQRKIVAEIKNKHNTLNAAGLSSLYNQMLCVTHKTDRYFNYTAYYVFIIPSHAQRVDESFVPSSRTSTAKIQPHDKIRKIDGYSFYDLLTGKTGALQQLYAALPAAIERAGGKKFTAADVDYFNKLFSRAFNGVKR